MIDNNLNNIEFVGEPVEPRWTLRRIIYLTIVLITLIVFLLYTLWPAFFPSTPSVPRQLPHQQV